MKIEKEYNVQELVDKVKGSIICGACKHAEECEVLTKHE